ncbi:MAG: O-antigen ligase family protein [Actinomycetota bacterium]
MTATTSPVGRLSAALRHQAAAAVMAQGLTAGSSLILQVIAARGLDLATYGHYAIMLSLMIAATAVATGWVGDSLAVLDRFDGAIRRALLVSHLAISAAAGALGLALTLLLGLGDLRIALLFAAVVVAWLFEDLGRRILMVRNSFWALVVNDAWYATVALGTTVAGWAIVGELSLGLVLFAMLIGASSAFVLAMVQVPAEERTLGSWHRDGLSEVARFAAWRSLQSGLRPAVLLLVRILVTALASAAALGRLEAARLLVQPVLVLANGITSYLLPRFSGPDPALRGTKPLQRTVLALAVAAGAYGLLAVVFEPQLSALILGDEIDVDRVAVASWAVFAFFYVVGLPAAVAVIARRRSRYVFQVRLADSVLAVGVVAAILVVGSPDIVPLGIALGDLIGAAILMRRAMQLLRAGPVGEDGVAAAAPLRPEPPSGGRAPVSAPTAATGRAQRPHRNGRTTTFDQDWMPSIVMPDQHQRPPVEPMEPVTLERDVVEVPRERRRRVTAILAHAPVSKLTWPWWFATALLGAMIASDYEFRRRDVTAALESSVDVQILLEILVYGVIAGVLLAFGFRGSRVVTTGPRVFAWGFAVTALVSVVYAPFVGVAAVRAAQLMVVVGLVTTVARQGTRVHLHLFAHAYLVLVMVSVAIGIVLPLPRLRLQEDRFNWLFMHPVVAGGYLMFAVLICVAYLRQPRSRLVPWTWPTSFYGVTLAVCSVMLLATQTRGSIGAAVVGVYVILLVSARRRARADLIIVGGLAGVVFLAFAFGALIDIATRGEGAESLTTLNSRTELWSQAFAVFAESPLFGHGFFATRGIFLEFIGLGGAHNAYVEVLVDLGIVGMFFWLGIFFACGGELRRNLNRDRFDPDAPLLAGMMAAILVNGITFEGAATAANVQHAFLFLVVGWTSLLGRERLAERSDRAGREVPVSTAPRTSPIDTQR